MAVYDQTIAYHLEKVEVEYQKLEERNANTEKGDKRRKAGPGSKITFLSNDTQNKLIEIIATEIVSEIVQMIDDCMAWALIADTTPDVIKNEQLRICVRVASKEGNVSEHLFVLGPIPQLLRDCTTR